MSNIITWVVCGLPFVFLPLPWWADIIAIFVILTFPVIGNIVGTTAWVWALVIQLQEPFSFLTIVVIAGFLFSVCSLWFPELYALFHNKK